MNLLYNYGLTLQLWTLIYFVGCVLILYAVVSNSHIILSPLLRRDQALVRGNKRLLKTS